MNTTRHSKISIRKGSKKSSFKLTAIELIVVMIALLISVLMITFCMTHMNNREESNNHPDIMNIIETNNTNNNRQKEASLQQPTIMNNKATTTTTTTTHHCVNDDFHHTHKTSIWTMLNDNPAYIESALKLGRALKKHTTETDFDLVVMTLKHKPLSEASMKKLSQVGFVNCAIDPIHPTHLEGKTRKDLTEKFGVLHVFAMEVYDTVLFLDADTFVQGSVDDLLQMDLQGKTIGVTKDIRARKWVDTFNTGVMLLHPSLKTYDHLMKLLMDETFEFEYIMSDQGFLNEVYKDDWHEIGFLYNANLALYRFQRKFWDQHKLEDIRIIHYTMQKPWKCNAKGPYGPICKVWIDAE